MEYNKKLGTMVVDGKLINLDNTPVEEMERVLQSITNKEKKLRQEVNQILHIEDEDRDSI